MIFCLNIFLPADDSALELTPVTLSQISAIDVPENDTLTATFKRKKRRVQNDDTLEMAVQCARGEPDGAERFVSFFFILSMLCRELLY